MRAFFSPISVAAVSLLATASLSIAACTTVTTTSTLPEKCGEPLYDGGATDEAWLILEMNRAAWSEADSRLSWNLSLAEDSTPISSQIPTQIAWISSLPRPVLTGSVTRSVAGSWFDRVSNWLIPVAHAHLPPVTSDIYYARIVASDGVCLGAVLTTHTTWDVPDDIKANIQTWLTENLTGYVEIRLAGAVLEKNIITGDVAQIEPYVIFPAP